MFLQADKQSGNQFFIHYSRFFQRIGYYVVNVFDENNTPYEVPSQKDRIIKEVAFEKGYILVDISEMKNNNSMFAWDEYPNNGAIGSHPNDKGMEFIANKIKEKL